MNLALFVQKLLRLPEIRSDVFVGILLQKLSLSASGGNPTGFAIAKALTTFFNASMRTRLTKMAPMHQSHLAYCRRQGTCSCPWIRHRLHWVSFAVQLGIFPCSILPPPWPLPFPYPAHDPFQSFPSCHPICRSLL